MGAVRERLHWLAMHGVIRGFAALGVRRGDPQARMIADPAVRADPIAFYDELRARSAGRGPLIRCRASLLTVEHKVVHDILRSEDFRVISLGSQLPAPVRWLERRTRPDDLHPLRPPSLLAVEPPDHTRFRKTVSSVFTARAVAALRERVQDTAEALLDDLSGASGPVDVVDRYCAQLPVAVISDILGVPETDRPRVLEYGEAAAPSLDVGLTWEQHRRVADGLKKFNAWLIDHLAELRRNPGDNLMSELIRTADEGALLDDRELRGIAGLVLAAGFETTVNLLGNGIRMLIDAPDQLALLHADPQRWPNAVEEILRLDSPVQLSARIALRDVDVAGTRVLRGELVMLYLAAANRDPAMFDDPDRFDVTRANAGRHLAFSAGRHFCLGAALARAEGEVGLRAFFERFPDARAAGPGQRRDTRVLRGWSALPVTLDPTLRVRPATAGSTSPA